LLAAMLLLLITSYPAADMLRHIHSVLMDC